MSDQATQIEKTTNGYEVFGHRFNTRTAAEDFVWAETAQSKLRSEQFLWESLRDVTKPKAPKPASKQKNSESLQALVTRRLDDMASKHRGWLIATVLVLALTIVASVWLSSLHPAGRWFFMSFLGWWFLLERNFWRCPACDIKLAPGLFNSAVSIRKIGDCPGCKISLSGQSHNH